MSASTRRRRLAATVAAAALGVGPVAVATTANAAPSADQSIATSQVAKRPAKRAPKPIKLDLLAINDFHGNLEAPSRSSNSSGRIFTSPTESVSAGGAAWLATRLERMRANSKARGARTLTVAAGDLIGASPLISAAFHDEPTIEALNTMGLDIASVGNHEFDEGWREVLRMQYGGCLEDGNGANGQNSCPDVANPFRGADFRYLAANVKFAKNGRTVLPAYQIRKVRGVKVGFIGMTLENTPNIVTRSATAGLRFVDEIQAVREVLPELKSRGVKAMVVLLHEGGVPEVNYQRNGCPNVSGPGLEIAENLPKAIDVVVSGHTHAAYKCVVRDPAGRKRLFTSASSFGRMVTKIKLRIDPRTKDVIRSKVKARNNIVENGTDETSATDPRRHPAILSLIAKYNELVLPIASEVIGRVVDTDGDSALTRTSDATSGDSELGNLIADSQLRDPSVVTGGQQPEIAFMNPGGIRTDLKLEAGGAVTYGNAFAVQPFNNFVTSITLTGQQILDVLNEQWNDGNEARPAVLQVAGLSYTYDRSEAALPDTNAVVGTPQVDLDRNGSFESPLDPSRDYRVVVNSFLVDGGDNFATLAEGRDRFFGGLDIDSLRQFLQPTLAGTPYTPPATDRITVQP